MAARPTDTTSLHTVTMTRETTHLLETLRGHRALRPTVDPSLAGGLRAWLEDDLAPLVSARSATEPLFLTPRSITIESLSTVPPIIALARSSLVAALVAQHALGLEVVHPMDDALGALEADESQSALVEAIHALDPDAFARLSAEVAAHLSTLTSRLTAVPPTWLPRTNVQITTALAGGRVVLGGVVSLAVGPPAIDHATVCLLEVSTRIPDATVERRLGVLALIETLRSGAAPLRVASLSTATGGSVVIDVRDDLLTAALAEVIGAVTQRATAQ